MASTNQRGVEHTGNRGAKPVVKGTTARNVGQAGSSNRGFASIDPERQREVAQAGKRVKQTAAPVVPVTPGSGETESGKGSH